MATAALLFFPTYPALLGATKRPDFFRDTEGRRTCHPGQLKTSVLNWTSGVLEFREVEYFLNSDLDYRGFYAILAGLPMLYVPGWYWTKRLLYIGQAYHQSIRDRVPQPHPAYAIANQYFQSHPSHVPLVMVGLRMPTTTPTEELYNDIEAALIYANQPLCNDQGKKEYTGRPIQIANHGDSSPLRPAVRCG